LVLTKNGGAAFVVGASARPPRVTPGQLPPLSTKGSNCGYQSSSSGTVNAQVKTAEVVWLHILEELAQSNLLVSLTAQRTPGTLPALSFF
jgi:hypothetical protein